MIGSVVNGVKKRQRTIVSEGGHEKHADVVASALEKGTKHEHISTWMCFVFGKRVSHFRAWKHQCFDVSMLVNRQASHWVVSTMLKAHWWDEGRGRNLPSIIAFAGDALCSR
jgi:hypothetical protein